MTAVKRRIPRTLVPLFVILALAGVLALWSARRSSPPNVLWITIDSLRHDHLACMGYERPTSPNIDALATESALFDQCIAQSNYTNISVPSMVTGIYPALLDVRTPLHDLDDLFVTLAEHLAGAGYTTSGVLPDWPGGINQGFQRLEVPDSDTDRRTRACLDILGSLDERPFFIWLYYWDPHAPYLPPEEFGERFGIEPAAPPVPEGARVSDEDLARWRRSFQNRQGWEMMKTLIRINEGNARPEEGYREDLIARYDAEIAYVDDRLGQVLGAVRELGLWDETMIILNADHGEGFGEHGLYFHGYGLYDEEVRVPLIIKPPRSLSSPRIIQTAVRNLDIMPTVLDYCGLSVPEGLNGTSLRPGIDGDRLSDLPAAMESNTPEKGVHLVGYRKGGFKVIYRQGSPPELYHLAEDPHERTNLLSAAGGTAGPDPVGIEQQLRHDLLAVYGVEQVEDLLYTYRRRNIDPRNLEKLRALGYIY
jgi:arylsulfatase A-like enzyme